VPLNPIIEKQADFGCDRFQDPTVTICLLRGLSEAVTLASCSAESQSLASPNEKGRAMGAAFWFI
jgi:hypothetical protein